MLQKKSNLRNKIVEQTIIKDNQEKVIKIRFVGRSIYHFANNSFEDFTYKSLLITKLDEVLMFILSLTIRIKINQTPW